MRLLHLVFLLGTLLIIGCGQSGSPSQSNAGIDDLSRRITSLESRPGSAPLVTQNNAQLTERLASLESDCISLSNRVAQLEWNSFINTTKGQFVDINPDEKGYSKLETALGPLFVSTDSIDPYLDGFKIHLRIGNPSSATFSDFKLIALWGPQWTNFDDVSKWQSEQKRRTNDMTASLLAGSWNSIDLTLAPATASEMRNVRISIELSKLYLNTPFSSPR